jgi:hypothetical protein
MDFYCRTFVVFLSCCIFIMDAPRFGKSSARFWSENGFVITTEFGHRSVRSLDSSPNGPGPTLFNFKFLLSIPHWAFQSCHVTPYHRSNLVKSSRNIFHVEATCHPFKGPLVYLLCFYVVAPRWFHVASLGGDTWHMPIEPCGLQKVQIRMPCFST